MSHDELLARHRAVLPSWLALYYDEPIELAEGQGRHVVDGEGNRYLDFFGGILTTMTGYDVPEVTAAIREQAGRMIHTSTLYLIRQQVELAEMIADLSGIPDARVFFTTSGTEANEAALLVASSFRRSSQIVAVRNSYHGRSFATIGITGNRGWSPSSLTPFQVSYMQSGYRFRSPFRHLDDGDFIEACTEDLRDVIATQTSGDIAALIAEPVQGVGGFAIPPDGFFGPVEKVCREHDMLFIADEVQTGWGRTGGKWFGIEQYGVKPDLVVGAKSLGNGHPIGMTLAKAAVADSFKGSTIATFGGNPVTMAACKAVVDVIAQDRLLDNAAMVGTHFRMRLDGLFEKHALVGEVRGMGLMQGIELVKNRKTKEPAPEATAAVMEAAKERGVIIGKGGLLGNVLRISPPLNVTPDDADQAADVIDAALGAVAKA
jgi:4-aminobutyrate aminotransferase